MGPMFPTPWDPDPPTPWDPDPTNPWDPPVLFPWDRDPPRPHRTHIPDPIGLRLCPPHRPFPTEDCVGDDEIYSGLSDLIE